MKMKRYLSALLATLLLAASFASCATGTEADEEYETQSNAAASEEETTSADHLPSNLNFDNMELTIAGNKRAETLAEIAVSNLIGEPVNDAVFERNTTVERRLGVKIVSYEETLRTKIAQDPQSAEMMDVIVDGIYIDAGIIYVASLQYFHQELRAVVRDGQNNAISRFKSKSKVAKKGIEKINKSLAELAEKNNA